MNGTLEQLVANLTGRVERKTLNGRPVLVAPVSMMTPGVRAGSQGPLLYRDGLAENHDVWNGIPIVLRHPVDKDGNPVSARSPEVLNDRWLGNVYGSQGDGKLTGHAWFDVQALTNADAKLPDSQKIMPRLLRGEPIEISTGLYTRNKEAPGTWNDGTRYTHEVVAATPDHLAVLPDQKGACSVADGCGINVNQRASAVSRLFRFLGAKLGLVKNEPSDDLAMSPEKACQILKDGEVHGQPLSDDQRGMFGALCGEARNEKMCWGKPCGDGSEAMSPDEKGGGGGSTSEPAPKPEKSPELKAATEEAQQKWEKLSAKNAMDDQGRLRKGVKPAVKKEYEEYQQVEQKRQALQQEWFKTPGYQAWKSGQTKNAEEPAVNEDPLPWDECISKMAAKGHTGEHAKDICGAIKAGTANERMCWGRPCDEGAMAPDEKGGAGSSEGMDEKKFSETAKEHSASLAKSEHLSGVAHRMESGRMTVKQAVGETKVYPEHENAKSKSDVLKAAAAAKQEHLKSVEKMAKANEWARSMKAHNQQEICGAIKAGTANQADDELSWGECVSKLESEGNDRTTAENVCSGLDGSESNQETNSMKIPAQAVANLKKVLATNCKCGGVANKGNKELAVTVAQLKDKIQGDALNRGARAVLNIRDGQLVINAEGDAAGVDIAKLAKFLAIDINPGSDPAGFIKSLLAKLDEISKQLSQPEDMTDAGADEGAEAPPPVAMSEEPPATTNRRQAVSNLTAEEREDIEWARAEKVKQKQAIVNRLVANSSATDEQKEQLTKNLMKKSLVELKDLALLAPAQPVQNRDENFDDGQGSGHWVGVTGGHRTVVHNTSKISDAEQAEIDAMTPPVLNFKKKQAVA